MTEEIKSVGANLPEKDWFKFDGDKFVSCDKDGNIIRKQPVKNLRDEMAMAALTGLATNAYSDLERDVALAYKYADAMLKAREEKAE